MERRFGLSIGTLAGAAILAFFVLAGALLMASSQAGASTVQTARTYQFVGTASDNDMTQGTDLAIVQGDQGSTFNQSSDINVPEGNSLVVRNLTSEEQVVMVAGTGGCHARHMGVRWQRIEPGQTTTLSFGGEGSYTIHLQSNYAAQLGVNVGDN